MNKKELIREACAKHNLIVIDGKDRWVPCWMCGTPMKYREGFDYKVEKPICSTQCANEKREHYD